jgi:suppressor for copper-sensitivity B
MRTTQGRNRPALLAIGFLALAAMAAPARAQLEIFPGLGGNKGDDIVPVAVSGVFHTPAGGVPGRLLVTAEMQPGWNIYSITQAAGGPVPTQIKIATSPDFKVSEFTAVDKPEVHPEPAFNNLAVEKHLGRVTWSAPLEFAAGVDPAKLKIEGSVFCQACEKVCRAPTDYKFVAMLASATASPPTPAVTAAPPSGGPPSPAGLGLPKLGGPPLPSAAPPAAAAPSGGLGKYVPEMSHLTWQGRVVPGTIAPGGKAKLIFTASMAPTWHVYAVEAPQKSGNQATLFAVTEPGLLKVGPPVADRAPLPPHGQAALADSKLLPYYEQEVVWTLDVEVPTTAKPGETAKVAGLIGFQTCDVDSSCDRPQAVHFDVGLTIAAAEDAASVQPVRFFEPTSYREVAKLFNAPKAEPAAGVDLANLQVQQDAASASLPVMLLTAFVAGFILNFMPCVLPVIGLKVLSFVEQSGNDRRRIFLLNVWYALGMLTVFWVLATIPVVLRIGFNESFGWGQQFSFDGFNITLISIVFVMALSFLGVWEIPIPGFTGSGGAQKAASKEGASGAFVKGIITTLLATPCSGPGLATAVGFALRESPPVTYSIFTAMGLGMASPYLLIGLQPSLLKWLPKPGEWMDTFKQLMGFVLLGTVVWLMSSIEVSRLLPTLTLLVGLWAACWWIGRVPIYAELPQKTKAWLAAGAFAAVIGWFAFGTLQGVVDYRLDRYVDARIGERMRADAAAPSPTAVATGDSLPWRHFSLPALDTALKSKQTVLIDFTADWCATCKTLKYLYLDRPETKKLIEELGVVPFEADMTRPPQEHTDLLLKLNRSGGVPVIAIFPADRPNEPIVFADGYTQTQILEALRKAGPSQTRDEHVKLGMHP